MSQPALGIGAGRGRRAAERWGIVLFLVVTVAGIYIAKWSPYYAKAFVAAAKHSIGASVISGTAAAAPPAGWAAAWQYGVSYVNSIWIALVVGLLVGSGVEAALPRAWLMRVLGGRRFGSTALAGAVAVPAMMCTCCSAPVAVGMAKSRASVGATLAFWLGNPLLNPATIIFMGFVLGWRWVALRIVFGALLVFGVSQLADRWLGRKDLPAGAMEVPAEDDRRLLVRWAASLGRLAVGLLPEYLAIVLILGAVRAWLFPAMTPAIGGALWLVLVLAVAGTLFVIPTAGEIPIIQTLMRYGLGAAGAGTLLITLPAVSLPSLAMVGRALPARVLVFVAVAVVIAGLLTGVAATMLGLQVL